MQDVTIQPLPIDWLAAVIGFERLRGVRCSLMRLRRLLGDRTVWTVNSTAAGGGVAEMLPRVHRHYRDVLATNTETLLGRVRPGAPPRTP